MLNIRIVTSPGTRSMSTNVQHFWLLLTLFFHYFVQIVPCSNSNRNSCFIQHETINKGGIDRVKFYFLETSRKLSTLYNKEDYSPNKLDFLNEMNLSLVFASVNCTHNIPPTVNPLWLEILGGDSAYSSRIFAEYLCKPSLWRFPSSGL